MNNLGYVSVDKLIEFANNHIAGIDTNDIARFPKADVEEVVRCKDCKYCNKIDEYDYWCKGRGFPGQLITPDDYCSKGRKRK